VRKSPVLVILTCPDDAGVDASGVVRFAPMPRRGTGGGGTRLLTCLRRAPSGRPAPSHARPCLAEPTSADYLIDFWNADSGLPGNSATALAQTREGYLWLGTYDA